METVFDHNLTRAEFDAIWEGAEFELFKKLTAEAGAESNIIDVVSLYKGQAFFM